MNTSSKSMRLALLLAGVGLTGTAPGIAAPADPVDGRWNASLTTQAGTVIPFRLDISGSGPTLKGTLYDGFDPYETTTAAKFEDGQLTLSIDHYLTTITANVKDGQLTGNVVSQNRGSSAQYGFPATRYVKPTAGTTDVPSIAG